MHFAVGKEPLAPLVIGQKISRLGKASRKTLHEVCFARLEDPTYTNLTVTMRHSAPARRSTRYSANCVQVANRGRIHPAFRSS